MKFKQIVPTNGTGTLEFLGLTEDGTLKVLKVIPGIGTHPSVIEVYPTELKLK